MAEKAKEQVLEELLAIQREWTPAHDANGEPVPLSDGQSIDIGRRYDQARAAVLARMCGPGEVVVPKEPTEAMIGAADAAIRQRAYHGPMSQVAALHEAYGSFIAARPQGEGK